MPKYIDFVPTSVLVTVFVTQMRFQKRNAYILWNTVLCHFRMTFSVFCILVGWPFLRQGPISIYALSPQHLCFKSNLNRSWCINLFCLYWHAEFIISFLENQWTVDSLLFTVHAAMKPLCRNEVLITVLILVLEYVKLMGLFCFSFQAIPNVDLKQRYEAHWWNNSLPKSVALSYECLNKKEQRPQNQTCRLTESS